MTQILHTLLLLYISNIDHALSLYFSKISKYFADDLSDMVMVREPSTTLICFEISILLLHNPLQ